MNVQTARVEDYRLNPDFVCQMMGFPDGWLDGTRIEISERDEVELLEYPDAPAVIRKEDRPSDTTDQLKAFGNAVIPQIPEIIGRAIMQIEAES